MDLENVFDIGMALNSTLGSMGISIYIINDNQQLEWINEVGLKKCHVPTTPGEVSAMHCVDACPHLAQEEIQTLVGKVFRTGSMGRCTLQVKDEKGGKEYLRFIILPIKNKKEETERVLIAHMPLEGDERTRWEMRLAERNLARLTESAADAIIALDESGRIEFWNKGAEQIFGYTKQEVLGLIPEFLIPEKLRKEGEFEWLLRTTREQGAIVSYETERLAKGGRAFIADITRTVMLDEDGNIRGSSAIIKDITERKRVDEELKLSLDRLSKLNQIADILHGTRDMNEILRLILAAVTAGEGFRYNRAFLLLVDQENGRLRGELAVGPGNVEEASQIWSHMASTAPLTEALPSYTAGIGISDKTVNDIVKTLEFPLNDESHFMVKALQSMHPVLVKRNSGEDSQKLALLKKLDCNEAVLIPLFGKRRKIGILIIDNKISCQPMREEDFSILRIFGSQSGLAIENALLYQRLNDQLAELQVAYSDLSKSQSRLREAERLATVGEMTACMAHEIRNPLVSIGGFARVLQRELEANEKLSNYAHILVSETTRLEKILTNLLNSSNPSKGGEKMPENLNAIIKKTLILIEEELKKAGISLHKELDPRLPDALLSELDMMQIFLNIFRNAIQAMNGNGKIMVRTYSSDNVIVVEVEDTGSGIPSAIRDKIFDPFFTTKPEGTGLGLWVTKQLLSRQGGSIRLQAQAEKGGTLFQLRLPAYDKGNSASTVTQIQSAKAT